MSLVQIPRKPILSPSRVASSSIIIHQTYEMTSKILGIDMLQISAIRSFSSRLCLTICMYTYLSIYVEALLKSTLYNLHMWKNEHRFCSSKEPQDDHQFVGMTKEQRYCMSQDTRKRSAEFPDHASFPSYVSELVVRCRSMITIHKILFRTTCRIRFAKIMYHADPLHSSAPFSTVLCIKFI